MIEWVKFRIGQHRIQRSMNKIIRAYKEDEQKTRANGTWSDEKDQMNSSLLSSELSRDDDEMITLISSYYLRQARHLIIPVPEYKAGVWEHSEFNNTVHLVPEALHDLRAKINSEKKMRRDAWMDWLAAITGIIGALIGLIAIMKD